MWRFQHSWLGRWHLFQIFRTHNSATAYEIPISTISRPSRNFIWRSAVVLTPHGHLWRSIYPLALPNSHKAWSPRWLWDGARWLRRTVGPFMTVGPAPQGSSRASPLPLGFAILVGDGGAVGLKSHKSPLSNDVYARSHGKMTFPAATSRREKVRCLSTGSSMIAQSR